MKSNTVDIIIPVYNTPAQLFEDCILSALKQTYGGVIKIIIIDDGSTNADTLEVIKKYASKENISVYRQKNGGVSSARNNGLSHSAGDYVFFLDSDDYIEEKCIENLVSVSKMEHSPIVFSGKINSSTNRNDAPYKSHLIDFKKDSDTIMIKSLAFSSQGVLIGGDIARSVSFNTNALVGEDTAYMIEAMTKGRSYYDGSGVYHYVQNQNSVMHDDSLEGIRQYLNEVDVQIAIFKRYLPINSSTINYYLYLKLLRAHYRLCGITSRTKATYIAKKFKEKYSLEKPSMSSIARTNLLVKGEKIRIILLSRNLFSAIYYLNKMIIALRG